MQSTSTTELTISTSAAVTLKTITAKKSYELTLSGGAQFILTKEELMLLPELYQQRAPRFSFHATVVIDIEAWKAIPQAAFEYILGGIRAQLAKVENLSRLAAAKVHDFADELLVATVHACQVVGHEILMKAALAELNIRWGLAKLHDICRTLKVQVNFAVKQILEAIEQVKFLLATRYTDTKKWLIAFAKVAENIARDWLHQAAHYFEEKKESILSWAHEVYLNTIIPLLDFEVVCKISLTHTRVHELCMPVMWNSVILHPSCIEESSDRTVQLLLGWTHVHRHVKKITISCKERKAITITEKDQFVVKQAAGKLFCELASRHNESTFLLRPETIKFDAVEIDASWSFNLRTLNVKTVQPKKAIKPLGLASTSDLAVDCEDLSTETMAPLVPFVHTGLTAVSVTVRYNASRVVYRVNAPVETVTKDTLDPELSESYAHACIAIQDSGLLKHCAKVEYVHIYFQERKTKRTCVVVCGVRKGKLVY